jgi:hypothetical protein
MLAIIPIEAFARDRTVVPVTHGEVNSNGPNRAAAGAVLWKTLERGLG